MADIDELKQAGYSTALLEQEGRRITYDRDIARQGEFQKSWIKAARLAYEMMEDGPPPKNMTDAQIAEWGLDFARDFGNRIVGWGTLNVLDWFDGHIIEGGSWGVSNRLAEMEAKGRKDIVEAVRFMDMAYEKMDDDNKYVIGYSILDPTNLLGAGGAAAASVKLGAKIIGKALTPMATTVASTGAGLAEGFGASMWDDSYRQKVDMILDRQHEYSIGRGIYMGAVGATTAGILTGTFKGIGHFFIKRKQAALKANAKIADDLIKFVDELDSDQIDTPPVGLKPETLEIGQNITVYKIDGTAVNVRITNLAADNTAIRVKDEAGKSFYLGKELTFENPESPDYQLYYAGAKSPPVSELTDLEVERFLERTKKSYNNAKKIDAIETFKIGRDINALNFEKKRRGSDFNPDPKAEKNKKSKTDPEAAEAPTSSSKIADGTKDPFDKNESLFRIEQKEKSWIDTIDKEWSKKNDANFLLRTLRHPIVFAGHMPDYFKRLNWQQWMVDMTIGLFRHMDTKKTTNVVNLLMLINPDRGVLGSSGNFIYTKKLKAGDKPFLYSKKLSREQDGSTLVRVHDLKAVINSAETNVQKNGADIRKSVNDYAEKLESVSREISETAEKIEGFQKSGKAELDIRDTAEQQSEIILAVNDKGLIDDQGVVNEEIFSDSFAQIKHLYDLLGEENSDTKSLLDNFSQKIQDFQEDLVQNGQSFSQQQRSNKKQEFNTLHRELKKALIRQADNVKDKRTKAVNDAISGIKDTKKELDLAAEKAGQSAEGLTKTAELLNFNLEAINKSLADIEAPPPRVEGNHLLGGTIIARLAAYIARPKVAKIERFAKTIDNKINGPGGMIEKIKAAKENTNSAIDKITDPSERPESSSSSIPEDLKNLAQTLSEKAREVRKSIDSDGKDLTQTLADEYQVAKNAYNTLDKALAGELDDDPNNPNLDKSLGFFIQKTRNRAAHIMNTETKYQVEQGVGLVEAKITQQHIDVFKQLVDEGKIKLEDIFKDPETGKLMDLKDTQFEIMLNSDGSLNKEKIMNFLIKWQPGEDIYAVNLDNEGPTKKTFNQRFMEYHANYDVNSAADAAKGIKEEMEQILDAGDYNRVVEGLKWLSLRYIKRNADTGKLEVGPRVGGITPELIDETIKRSAGQIEGTGNRPGPFTDDFVQMIKQMNTGFGDIGASTYREAWYHIWYLTRNRRYGGDFRNERSNRDATERGNTLIYTVFERPIKLGLWPAWQIFVAPVKHAPYMVEAIIPAFKGMFGSVPRAITTTVTGGAAYATYRYYGDDDNQQSNPNNLTVKNQNKNPAQQQQQQQQQQKQQKQQKNNAPTGFVSTQSPNLGQPAASGTYTPQPPGLTPLFSAVPQQMQIAPAAANIPLQNLPSSFTTASGFAPGTAQHTLQTLQQQLRQHNKNMGANPTQAQITKQMQLQTRINNLQAVITGGGAQMADNPGGNPPAKGGGATTPDTPAPKAGAKTDADIIKQLGIVSQFYRDQTIWLNQRGIGASEINAQKIRIQNLIDNINNKTPGAAGQAKAYIKQFRDTVYTPWQTDRDTELNLKKDKEDKARAEKNRKKALNDLIVELERIRDSKDGDYNLSKSQKRRINDRIADLREAKDKTPAFTAKAMASAENLLDSLNAGRRSTSWTNFFNGAFRPTQMDDPNSELHGTFNSMANWGSSMLGGAWDWTKGFFSDAWNGRMEYGQPLLQYGGALGIAIVGATGVNWLLDKLFVGRIPILGTLLSAAINIFVFLGAARAIGKMQPNNAQGTGNHLPSSSKAKDKNIKNKNKAGKPIPNPAAGPGKINKPEDIPGWEQFEKDKQDFIRKNWDRWSNQDKKRFVPLAPVSTNIQGHAGGMHKTTVSDATGSAHDLAKPAFFAIGADGKVKDTGHYAQSKSNNARHVPKKNLVSHAMLAGLNGGSRRTTHLPLNDIMFANVSDRELGLETGIHGKDTNLGTNIVYGKFGPRGYQEVALAKGLGTTVNEGSPELTAV